MTHVNRRIVLAARPHGEPNASHFRLEEGRVPVAKEGEVLLANRYLSLDPYMRGRMSAAKSYAEPVAIGDTMVGATVAEVIESRHPDFRVGETVVGFGGWQDFAVSDGRGLRRLDPEAAPVTTALGILGMPGMTAYTGLLNIGQPKPGETVVVAAATGPVGSLVGQIARRKGARAVGIAGGPEKCAFLRDTLGFDAAIDHRAEDFPDALAAACPEGIDVYFENVGGAVFDAVLPLLNNFARMPVCGLVSGYNATELPPGPDRVPVLMRAILSKRLHVQGFIVWDFAAQEAEFLREVGAWLRDGLVVHREDIVGGLENAPEAFAGLLQGRNFGKLIVRIR
ncbi:NADP-dependent oxidoreductase [Methylobacterium sp. Leaf104]|uniref:NADP-dependent oxidoreductase n=1 Tax=Methylobacterium TaxID=407 RepID=UPI0006F3CFD1|nr:MULTISPECIES: NADP-dependent oxidoreductase [Methylobacterium]KQP40956.1 NADP-dependent oxidoreductase [Methylobacterium sp. Leaf104]MCI9880828.1 NADP-dependent oxidoreductase [Methylobacterium goesingense]